MLSEVVNCVEPDSEELVALCLPSDVLKNAKFDLSVVDKGLPRLFGECIKI